jgi:uncharacterized Ntn-hydrolase superfamily protein
MRAAGANRRESRPNRPVSTYSIVARDKASGQLGVAVQSHWFSVGTIVPWAAPGVGAVATQAFAERAYGPKGLELMRAGLGAEAALAQLLAADPEREIRQVAMIDAAGRVTAHTGTRTIADARHLLGDGFSVQANTMERSGVCAAMAAAFTGTEGDLAARLLAALDAAEAEGGDIRGRQSAALLVVEDNADVPAWGGRVFDLRVEDHPLPLPELRRLVGLARAYRLMRAGDDAMGAADTAAALAHYRAAMALAPDNHEMIFWTAVALAGSGDLAAARPLFARAFALHAPWRDVVARLPAAGLLPAALVQRIAAAG